MLSTGPMMGPREFRFRVLRRSLFLDRCHSQLVSVIKRTFAGGIGLTDAWKQNVLFPLVRVQVHVLPPPAPPTLPPTPRPRDPCSDYMSEGVKCKDTDTCREGRRDPTF